MEKSDRAACGAEAERRAAADRADQGMDLRSEGAVCEAKKGAAGLDSGRGEGVKYSKSADDYSVYGKHFGYYDETGGSDTDTWASIWGRSKATDKGSRRLISHSDQWYMVEQSDSDPQGYFIIKRVADYYESLEEVEEYNDRHSKQGLAELADEAHRRDGSGGQTDRPGEVFDNRFDKYTGENNEVRGLAEGQHTGGQSKQGGLGNDRTGSEQDQSRPGSSDIVKRSYDYDALDSDYMAANEASDDIRYSSRDYTEYDKPITANDVQTLRSIGRKSINDFTADDIQKSQKWAYKFYTELENNEKGSGVKSPFFQAWFGEWRAYDKKGVVIVDKPSDTRRKHKNNDTGWEIARSAKVSGERHNSRASKSGYGLLP